MLNNIKESSLSKRIASVRILFGLVWAVDAGFKFQKAFYGGQNLITFITAKDSGEPGWLNPWFHFWYKVIGLNPEAFALFILVAEVLIALSLIFGIARRLNYALCVPFCFLIWGIGEAFGGPYVSGTTDINAGFIYVIVFLCLYVMDGLVTPSWSLDPWISKRLSWWPKVANPPKLKRI